MSTKTRKKRCGAACAVGALLLAGGILAGCGDAGPQQSENIQSGPTAAEENQPAEQVLEPHTSFLTEEEMALADMWPVCDDGALAALMCRAEEGEPVTVACIGGSITQGTVSKGSLDDTLEQKKAYAEIFREWWQERFPDTEITFINAGIGGTDSYLGVHRLEQDVMCHEPDLVLVEFSVNDSNDNFYKKTYDNLLYNILSDENAPAVMLLFMAQTNGVSAQANDVLVGFHYQVPMVSYANVMENMLETERFSEDALSGDGVHPSALGHAVTGEILWNYLNNVYAQRDSLEASAHELQPLTKETYGNARILDSDDIEPDEQGDFVKESVCPQFADGWGCDGPEGIVFTASFSRFGILYYATTDGKSGQVEVLVDGVAVRNLDGDFTGGWGNAIKAAEVYDSEEASEHTVEIRRTEDSTGDLFHLLGLLVSE